MIGLPPVIHKGERVIMAEGTVRVSGLNLRGSLTTGAAVKVLRRSSRVEILGEETWLRVRTRDGLTGYVFGDFIERDPPPDVAVEAQTPSKKLALERYHHERFVGNPVTADVDFFPLLDRIAGFAQTCKLFVHVTSSTRDPGGQVSGAIVEPAKRSTDLRWSGDFSTPDVVHVEDGLNLRNPQLWEAKLASRA